MQHHRCCCKLQKWTQCDITWFIERDGCIEVVSCFAEAIGFHPNNRHGEVLLMFISICFVRFVDAVVDTVVDAVQIDWPASTSLFLWAVWLVITTPSRSLCRNGYVLERDFRSLVSVHVPAISSRVARYGTYHSSASFCVSIYLLDRTSQQQCIGSV